MIRIKLKKIKEKKTKFEKHFSTKKSWSGDILCKTKTHFSIDFLPQKTI